MLHPSDINPDVAIWDTVIVSPADRLVYLGTTDMGFPMYFVPAENIVVRYVAAQVVDKWQKLVIA